MLADNEILISWFLRKEKALKMQSLMKKEKPEDSGLEVLEGRELIWVSF